MRFAAYLLLVVLTGLVCMGCGESADNAGTDACLLRVGETTVSLAEFQGLFDEELARGKVTPDTSAARAFLKQMIDQKLYDQIAVDSVPWTPILEHRANNYLENDMVEKMKYETYGFHADFKANELEAIYEELGGVQYHYLDAVFMKASDAAQQKTAIDEGADFKRIAEYFGGSNAGDVGFRTVLEIYESVIRELKTMTPGEIRGPIEAGDGFHIVQLIETADIVAKRDFAAIKDILRTRIFQDRGGKKLREFNSLMLEKYDYKPVIENAYWMNDWLREETKQLDRSQPETRMVDGQRVAEPNLNQQPPWRTNPFTREESMRPIVTTTTDTIPALELLDELVTKPVVIWPTFETPDELINMAKQMVTGRIEIAEAWSRGYAERPEFIEQDKTRRQKMFTRNFKTRFLQWRANVTEADAKAWYDERFGSVDNSPIKHYAMLMVATEEQAHQTAAIMKQTGSIDRALVEVRKLDPSVFKVDSDGLMVKEGKTSNPVEVAVLSLGKGDVTAPYLIGKRWAIGLVKDVTYQGAAPFEEIKSTIFQSLSKARCDSLLVAYLEERRAITKIEINETLFCKLVIPTEATK